MIVFHQRAYFRMLLGLVVLTLVSLWTTFSPSIHTSVLLPLSSSTANPTLSSLQPLGCSNLFLYIPHDISNNGICSQLQNYILAVHVAATFHRTLLILEPNNAEQASHTSVFGCPPDQSTVPIRPLYGLQQILDIPSLSSTHTCFNHICPFSYSEWIHLLSSSGNDFPIVTCNTTTTTTTTTVSIMVSGGRKLRRHYIQRLHQTPQQKNFTQWVTHLTNVTNKQLEWFQSAPKDPWRGVAGLIVPDVQWQPWLQPTLNFHLQQLQLPVHYTALHIRRGDKLKREATSMVQQYWAKRGENTNNINYIPLEAYVAQLHPSIDPPDIYIATDDPDTIRQEIIQLQKTNQTTTTTTATTSTYWNFHLLADHRNMVGHINTETDCHNRYNMTIEAIVDLEVMIRAQVFVGELNSNWGRFIQTMRTDFKGTNYPVLRDFRVVFGDNQTRYLGQ